MTMINECNANEAHALIKAVYAFERDWRASRSIFIAEARRAIGVHHQMAWKALRIWRTDPRADVEAFRRIQAISEEMHGYVTALQDAAGREPIGFAMTEIAVDAMERRIRAATDDRSMQERILNAIAPTIEPMTNVVIRSPRALFDEARDDCSLAAVIARVWRRDFEQ